MLAKVMERTGPARLAGEYIIASPIIVFCWQISHGRGVSMWQLIFFEQTAISTQLTALYERRINPFIDTLHFCSAFWMIAFWMLDVWHERYIQV